MIDNTQVSFESGQNKIMATAFKMTDGRWQMADGGAYRDKEMLTNATSSFGP